MANSSSSFSLTGLMLKITAVVSFLYVLDRAILSVVFQYLVGPDTHYLELPPNAPHLIFNALGYILDSTISSPLVPIAFALLTICILLISNYASQQKSRLSNLAMMPALAASIVMIAISAFNAYSLLGEMYFAIYTPSEWKNLVAIILLAASTVTVAAYLLLAFILVKQNVISISTALLLVVGMIPFTFGLLSIPVVSGNYYAPVWIWLTLIGVCLPIGLWKLSTQLS